MKEVLLIAAKALVGGSLVVAFSMLSDVLKPKAFAGLFSAAPSVALASLSLTAVVMGAGTAAEAASAMVAGAVGMVAFCAVAMLVERRIGAIAASAVAWISWAGCAGVMFVLFFR
jgi:hypothetical protein